MELSSDDKRVWSHKSVALFGLTVSTICPFCFDMAGFCSTLYNWQPQHREHLIPAWRYKQYRFQTQEGEVGTILWVNTSTTVILVMFDSFYSSRV